jgi:hypothetical protein
VRSPPRSLREIAAVISLGVMLTLFVVALAWFLAWVFSVAVRIAGSA